MGVTGVISADRRYVRISAAPMFSTIGDMQTFTFAGSSMQTKNGGRRGGHWYGTEQERARASADFNRGGGGIRRPVGDATA